MILVIKRNRFSSYSVISSSFKVSRESVNAMKYIFILNNTLPPFLEMIALAKRYKLVFQQDNAHHIKLKIQSQL